jgi:hypothetical protein
MNNNNILESNSNQDLKSSRILSDIVAFALANKNNPLKIEEVLQIEENNENIIMSLLKSKKFDLIEDLMSLGHLICKETILLSQSKALLEYLFTFGSEKIIIDFLNLLQSYSSPELLKEIFNYRNKDHKNSLMLYLTALENSDDFFDHLINYIGTNIGLDFLYQELNHLEKEGNNILLLAIKFKREKSINKIITLVQSMEKDLSLKLLSQSNSKGENLLSLLAIEELPAITEVVVELFRNNLDSQGLLLKVVEQDSEGNNPLLVAFIYHNQSMIEGLIKIIREAPGHTKKLILSRFCSDQNYQYDNFITLAFKEGFYNSYLFLIGEIEKNLEEQKILALLKKSLSRKGTFIKDVFMSHNSDAILSIIQYIKVLQNFSLQEKKIIERLILHKDQEERSLLLTAIAEDNYDSVNLILDLVKDLCDNLTHKLLLNSRDKYGNTAYLLAKNKKNILKQIENFALMTNNQIYLKIQDKEKELLDKIQQSPLSIIAIKKEHLSG